MKRKAIALSAWLIVSILYCVNTIDVGCAIGEDINDAIEEYSEMMVKYGGTTVNIDQFGEAMADMALYKMSHTLSDDFKFDFGCISITTVIYVGVSILCYNYGFIKRCKEKTKEKMNNEQRNVAENF